MYKSSEMQVERRGRAMSRPRFSFLSHSKGAIPYRGYPRLTNPNNPSSPGRERFVRVIRVTQFLGFWSGDDRIWFCTISQSSEMQPERRAREMSRPRFSFLRAPAIRIEAARAGGLNRSEETTAELQS